MTNSSETTLTAKTFYAVCWANGLVSIRLDATTTSEAKKELLAQPTEALATWIDDACNAIESDSFQPLDSTCKSMTDALFALGAVVESSPSDVDGDWQIWSYRTHNSTVTVGHVQTEHAADEDACDAVIDDLQAYVAADVTIRNDAGERTVRVSFAIGVHDSDKGSAKASGCGAWFYSGRPAVWTLDAHDFDDVPARDHDDVLDALTQASRRLWREVEALRV